MGSPANRFLEIPKNPAPTLTPVTGNSSKFFAASPYENMQLHTPSGLYYNNGKFYEAYTPTPLQRIQTMNPMIGASNNQSKTSGGAIEGSISSGDQWFKPFTGNTTGINMGELSPAYALTQIAKNYQPQPLPNLFPTLNTNLLQSQPTGAMEGANRFLGNNLLGSPIVTTNTQGK
jgi:hypothetical protein